ncbi:hypothetical protein FSP39_007629 [Pinctada imbricata]|uniref:Zinc metalloproteinase n=1 Tax=Pinctada imbricata TaxID=66713 RepID=A0AA89BVK6_PINIB|nr:hypothetical protein FSP39_007629 [Pinctada imbricata]
MKINIHNVTNRQTLSFHLPMIVGDIDSSNDDGHINIWNVSDRQCTSIKWPVIEGTFKAFVKLVVGENIINIQYQTEILVFKLFREVPNIPFFVRPVYIICSEDDGSFQGPEEEDCSMQSAVERISLAAMLIQTFTAEKMKEHQFGMKTFQLELDHSFEPLCHIFRSNLSKEQAHLMSGNELWTHFARELMASSLSQKDRCKWFCFMSFTRYIPPVNETPKSHSEILRHTKGHTALGGGGLALFGTGNLHTWARDVSEIHARFTDSRKIDRRKFMDDSAYREFYWANFATGLGASLHELGHTFDLAHTPSGIMARGFDDIHKVFTVQRSKVSKGHSRQASRSSSQDRSSLTSSTSSVESFSGSSINDAIKKICSKKDICFGSPVHKVSKLDQPNSSGSKSYIAPPPVIVKVESSFQPKVPSTLTLSVKNYDGTERHQTLSQRGEFELVTDLLLGSDGKLLAKTHTKRERQSSCSSVSTSSTPPSPIATIPSTLPNSPEEPLNNPQFHIKDGGAHWYRSSAVLLNFHKWFNVPNPDDPKKQPVFEGPTIKCSSGIRLVEVRSEPQGVVFHHWEFLKENPPIQFTLKLSRLRHLPDGTEIVSVLAEDSYGNITKRRVRLEEFEK